MEGDLHSTSMTTEEQAESPSSERGTAGTVPAPMQEAAGAAPAPGQDTTGAAPAESERPKHRKPTKRGQHSVRRKRHIGLIVVYVVTGALVTLATLLVFARRWAAHSFGNLSVDEIVFQLNAPMAGTGGGVVEQFVRASVVPAIIVLVLYVLACFVVAHRVRRGTWVPWHSKPPRYEGRHYRRDDTREKYKARVFSRRTALVFGGIAVASLVSSFMTLRRAWHDFGAADYYAPSEDGSDFVRDHYVNPAETAIAFPENKRNLLFIYLESMETTFADKPNGGAFDENRIPELTVLAKQNLDFAGNTPELNGGIAYAGATWTMGAMFAMTSGLPLQIDLVDNQNGMKTQSSFFPAVTTLGDILEAEGYRQVMLFGSDAEFGGRKLYYTEHGDFEMRDYYWAQENGLIANDYWVWWGYEDQKLFEFAKSTLTELAASGTPFNMNMLTADTHFEDGYKCALCPSVFDDRYSNILACSSRQTADFIEWCTQQDWFANTTIIITGDHPTMDSDFCEDIPADFPRRTYTCYINPAVPLADPEERRAFSTFDNFPTTLAAIGAQIDGERLGLGTNLFSDEKTLTEELGDDTVARGLNHASPFVAELASLDHEADAAAHQPKPADENTGDEGTEEDAEPEMTIADDPTNGGGDQTIHVNSYWYV